MTWTSLCFAQPPPGDTNHQPYSGGVQRSLEKALEIVGHVLMPNNVRQYTYGNMWISSEISHFDRYAGLQIGNPLTPYDGKRHLLVKMSNGSVIDLARISVDELKRKCGGSKEDCSGRHYCGYDGPPILPNETKWPAGTMELFDAGCTRNFFVTSGKIIEVQISWNRYDNQAKPEIGDPNTGKMYSFPLSESDLMALFGKPDQIIDFAEYF